MDVIVRGRTEAGRGLTVPMRGARLTRAERSILRRGGVSLTADAVTVLEVAKAIFGAQVVEVRARPLEQVPLPHIDDWRTGE